MMFALALSSLRSRKSAAAGGLVALFCAAMVICACGVLLETGLHGAIPVERYAGTPVVVTAGQQLHWTHASKHGTKTKSEPLSERAWLPDTVGVRLAALPAARVVADLIFPADLVRHGAVLSGAPGYGHGWSSAALTPYTLVSGTPPRRGDEVVLDGGLARLAGLAAGDRVTIVSTSAPKTYRVAGIARPDAASPGESAMFFDDDEARRLAGHDGMVAAYGVFGADAGRVAAAAGAGTVVSAGAGRGQAEFPGAARARVTLVAMAGAIGGSALIVAVLVVSGVLALSVQQRHRELALLRAIGAAPRQVRRLAGGPFPVIVAVLAAAGAGWAAARLAARRVARIRPVQAIAEAAAEPRRLGRGRVLAGLACTALATAGTVLLGALHTEPAAQPVSYLTVLAWMTAVALLGPGLCRGAVRPFGALLRASRVGGFLAARNCLAGSRRVASVVTPLALLIGMTATILFAPATLDAAARAQARAGITADYLIASSGPGVPAAAVQELRAIRGVRAVVEGLRTTVWVGEDRRSAQALSRPGLTQVIDPGVTSGSLTGLGPGTMAMSQAAAQGRHVGDMVRVTLGDGTATRLRLAAVYARGLGFADMLLDFGDVAGHVDDPLATAVLIEGAASSTGRRALVSRFPGLTVTDQAGAEQVVRRPAGAGVNLVFLCLLGAFTAIAVISTLAMSVHGRSGELALLRLAGATRRQVRHVLLCELALMVAVATALGTGAAWLTLSGFGRGMTGNAVPAIVPGTYALILAAATALGLVGTEVPARRVLRRAEMSG